MTHFFQGKKNYLSGATRRKTVRQTQNTLKKKAPTDGNTGLQKAHIKCSALARAQLFARMSNNLHKFLYRFDHKSEDSQHRRWEYTEVQKTKYKPFCGKTAERAESSNLGDQFMTQGESLEEKLLAVGPNAVARRLQRTSPGFT